MPSKRQAMFSSRIVPNTIQLLLLHNFLCVLCDIVHDDPPFSLCQNTSYFTDNSPFQSNLNDLLLYLNSNASASKFYNTSIGNGPDRVYGLFLCYKYLAEDDCKNCTFVASQYVRKNCAKKNDAVVWNENCQLRYSSESFFGHLDVTGNLPKDNTKNVSEPDRFRSVVNETLLALTKQAAFNSSTGMYVTGSVPFTDSDTIYALVQCTPDLSPADCNTCLVTAISDTLSCCFFSRGARLLSRSCYLRFEFYAFYQGVTEPAESRPSQDTVSGNSLQTVLFPIEENVICNCSIVYFSFLFAKAGGLRSKRMVIVLAVGSSILVVALLSFCLYCLVLRKETKKRESIISTQEIQLQDTSDPSNIDFLNQKLQVIGNLNPQDHPFIGMEIISAATDNFSDSNKLGQGGFGPVYMGILPNGKEVAVKRLSTSSEQGSDEFINEVLLIFKLQHKNLVKLLGFCVHGEEKLLIYEYMPNSSLDVFLFDPRKRAQLNWSRRLNIINGIARGMLYLHQDSRLRIIHRDLKPSNVLLDSDMNPKISDFGMARIFGGTDDEANTAKIVGTYGYMAPEFAMEGLYSIKSDVFSFGVLLLEIITGRRNAGFHLSKCGPSLVAYAWQLWNGGKGLELMDPLLTDSCCVEEFLRCMHIGLLCVQEDAHDRPNMSSVVVMLKSETLTLREPERPAFSVGRFTNHNGTWYNNLSINGLTLSDLMPR